MTVFLIQVQKGSESNAFWLLSLPEKQLYIKLEASWITREASCSPVLHDLIKLNINQLEFSFGFGCSQSDAYRK